VWSFGSVYGVVDHNTFDGNYATKNDPNDNTSHWNDWWIYSPQNIFALGGQRYLYWEDNTFTGNIEMVSDGEYEARYVYRYNTVTTSWSSGSPMQTWEMHGEQTSTPMASCFGGELYGNSVVDTGGSNVQLFNQRSGQTRVFFNVVSTSGSLLAVKWYTGSISSPCPTAQILDKLIHNSYAWHNWKTVTGTSGSYSADAGNVCGGRTSPTFGQDVFTESTTPGVLGCGSTLPGTCTVNDAYWKTSDTTLCSNLTNYIGASHTANITGSLYKCTATNTWSTDGDGITYTPYTYPHPLRH
jgi:hypothetical protein